MLTTPSLWLLPMEFTVRELDEHEYALAAGEDPEELIFVLETPEGMTLICPRELDYRHGGGGWRALLIAAEVSELLDEMGPWLEDGLVVWHWSQSYLLLPEAALEETRRLLQRRGYPVFSID